MLQSSYLRDTVLRYHVFTTADCPAPILRNSGLRASLTIHSTANKENQSGDSSEDNNDVDWTLLHCLYCKCSNALEMLVGESVYKEAVCASTNERLNS